jgi:hypothetical protein
MAGPFAPIIGWLGAKFAGFTIGAAAYWVAFKIFALAAIGTLLPIALWNGFVLIQEKMIAYGMSFVAQFANQQVPVTIQLSGLAGWLANLFQLPLCLSIILSAMAVRFTARLFRLF